MSSMGRHDEDAREVRGPERVPEPEFDPELEEDLGAEFELRGDRLAEDLEAAREEATKNLEVAQRVQAEFENFRKRMVREQHDATLRAGQRLVENLLPAIDNLERAIDHATAGGDSDLLTGVEMVLGQLLDVLAKEGATPVDPLGIQFDALRHHAVGSKEDADVAEGTVIEVYQKGYEMHGRVIRSAMVVVATGGPSAPEE
ncbi:MAG: nucleotide exchange factor GrpE [Actinomycetota bacterium]|nr:nucleotide exchange factor GrpE [Actinomycetota bacterium]